MEIDGCQHLRKDSIDHDIIRDKYLLENDWLVYRISVKEFYSDPNKVISELDNFIRNKEKYRKYDVDSLRHNTRKNTSKYSNVDEYTTAVKKENDLKYIDVIESIKKSNIDFSKLGWAQEVNRLTSITNATRWMRRFMPDFYKDKCFKRKGTK